MEKIMTLMKQLDVTESEAKVYLSLLKNGPSNGYEASKRSGVLRTKIYSILESLVIKGLAIMTRNEETSVYMANPMSEIISLRKKNLTEVGEALIRETEKLQEYNGMDYLFEISGYEKIMARALTLINSAEKELYVQVFREDLPHIEDALKRKESEGLDVIVVLFDEESHDKPFRHTTNHAYTKGKFEDLGGRFLNVTKDYDETVFAVLTDTTYDAIYTMNRLFIFIAKEYVKHDVYAIGLIEAANQSGSKIMEERVRSIRDIIDFH